ncbi:MAG TPA: lytic transglycosylase domain-containing protein [Ktedonobacteraceae bacterium]|nr:lytic transglycosylase domain-containing protein [Ktedonobacteraceae bacterium]
MQPIRLLPQTDKKKAIGKSNEQPVADAFSIGLPHSEAGVPPSPQVASAANPHQKQPSLSPGEKNTPPVPSAHAPSDKAKQPVPGSMKSAGRLVVIPANKKWKKIASGAKASTRHLNSRLRLAIVIMSMLVVFGGTIMTLIPLATSQSGSAFLQSLSRWIDFQQTGLQVAAQQTQVASTTHIVPAQLTLSHSEYVAIAQQDATDAGIPPTYFVRQIQLESGFNPNAVSPSGALGIAQFMPGTAAGLGIDPMDPIQALKGAARMMANLYHQYGDYSKALAAYNAGSANLNNAIQSCGANWLSCMPGQTQNYVATIMG